MPKLSMDWRERLHDLPPEQRMLVEGGSLSQRFANRPLALTHPVLMGGFYGFLIAVSLMLPYGYEKGWTQDTMRDWAFIGLLVMLISAITGHFSLIMAKVLKRPPVSLPRAWVYPMPFIGLSILSAILVTGIESELSENTVVLVRYTGWMLLLTPGPIYVHLSWAPRWRLLCRLEEGLDPFEGQNLPPSNTDEGDLNGDFDMDMAIEDIEEEPPNLHHFDGEE